MTSNPWTWPQILEHDLKPLEHYLLSTISKISSSTNFTNVFLRTQHIRSWEFSLRTFLPLKWDQIKLVFQYSTVFLTFRFLSHSYHFLIPLFNWKNDPRPSFIIKPLWRLEFHSILRASCWFVYFVFRCQKFINDHPGHSCVFTLSIKFVLW